MRSYYPTREEFRALCDRLRWTSDMLKLSRPAQASTLYRRGGGIEEIALIMGISTDGVKNHLRATGDIKPKVKPEPRWHMIPASWRAMLPVSVALEQEAWSLSERIYAAVQAGANLGEIAERLGITPRHARRLAWRAEGRRQYPELSPIERLMKPPAQRPTKAECLEALRDLAQRREDEKRRKREQTEAGRLHGQQSAAWAIRIEVETHRRALEAVARIPENARGTLELIEGLEQKMDAVALANLKRAVEKPGFMTYEEFKAWLRGLADGRAP